MKIPYTPPTFPSSVFSFHAVVLQYNSAMTVSYVTLHLSVLFDLVIEEKGVKMKLTVIDTPGFGDQINNENW